jgi:hypothetical protein
MIGSVKTAAEGQSGTKAGEEFASHEAHIFRFALGSGLERRLMHAGNGLKRYDFIGHELKQADPHGAGVQTNSYDASGLVEPRIRTQEQINIQGQERANERHTDAENANRNQACERRTASISTLPSCIGAS